MVQQLNPVMPIMKEVVFQPLSGPTFSTGQSLMRPLDSE
jgi:hypothetical protein